MKSKEKSTFRDTYFAAAAAAPADTTAAPVDTTMMVAN
jgi:hypothetical protein